MSLPVQCPQCGKQFNAKPELAGKRVKCSQCGSVISIPGGAAASQPAPSKPAPSRPAPARPAAAPQAPPQSFAPPAAAPMGGIGDMLEDASVGQIVAPTILRPGETMCPSCNGAVPMGASMCVKCGFDFRSGKVRQITQPKPLDPRIIKTLGAVGALVAVVVGGGIAGLLMGGFVLLWNGLELSKVDAQWMNYGISAMVVGGMLTLLFNATMLADAFKEGPGKGAMYLFVPGYSLYFICTRWSICWKPYFSGLISAWLLFAGVWMYAEGKRVEDAKPKLPDIKGL